MKEEGMKDEGFVPGARLERLEGWKVGRLKGNPEALPLSAFQLFVSFNL
jgi:hypothetical protein